MRVHLKIKVRSLAAEAQIIRREEQKHLAWSRETRPKDPNDTARRDRAKAAFWSLYAHRTGTVRREARASCLAYGFLRGRPYKALEAKCWEQPDWAKVQKLVERFSDKYDPDVKEQLKAWREAAELKAAA